MNDETSNRDERSPAERFWEQHYRKNERVWSGRANAVLVSFVEPLAPGTALDLGCAEGGDAIWLARRGWRVTAVDVSATALMRAADHAASAGVADGIDFQRHSVQPGQGYQPEEQAIPQGDRHPPDSSHCS